MAAVSACQKDKMASRSADKGKARILQIERFIAKEAEEKQEEINQVVWIKNEPLLLNMLIHYRSRRIKKKRKKREI